MPNTTTKLVVFILNIYTGRLHSNLRPKQLWLSH